MDLARLGNTQDLKNVLPMIRKPGWTTLAEIAFAFGLVESLLAQTKALSDLKGAFVKACESVGVDSI